MELWAAKLMAMILQMVILAGFCAMPIWVAAYFNRKTWGPLVLTCCRTFGGGALLGLFMIHKVPEINYLLGHAITDSFPVAMLISAAGFFFFNFLQLLVNYIKEKNEKSAVFHETTLNDVKVETAEDEGSKVTIPINTGSKVATLGGVPNGSVENGEALGNSNLAYDVEKTYFNGNDVTYVIPAPEKQEQGGVNTPEIETKVGVSDDFSADVTTTAATSGEVVDNSPVTVAAGSRSIILLIALCFDGMFQGLSIGLQRSNMAVLAVLLGIVSHEFAIAFTLGLELILTHTKRQHLVSAAVYGLTPCLGVIIGLIIYLAGDGDDYGEGYLVNGILQALAAGTFLYIVIVGILGRELQNPRIHALLTCLIGFCFIASLALYDPEEGEDGGSGTTYSPTQIS